MKIINMNIDINKEFLAGESDKVKVVINWIGQMLARASNKPDVNGRATKQASMEEQRKYNRIMNTIESHKNGIIEIDNDDYCYLKRKYNQAEMPLNRELTKLLVNIGNKIDEAKDKK